MYPLYNTHGDLGGKKLGSLVPNVFHEFWPIFVSMAVGYYHNIYNYMYGSNFGRLWL